MNAVAIPNMWAGKGKTGIITPLAILRTQAGNFNQEMKGLLRADVVTSPLLDDDDHAIKSARHTFYIVAPGLRGYTQEVLTAVHAEPGAYPVHLSANARGGTCESQSSFMDLLELIFTEYTESSQFESIIALVNEKNAEQ